MAGSTRAAERDWLSEMQRLFRSAHYVSASDLYDQAIGKGEPPGNDAVLLRARLFLKTDSKLVVPFLLREELRKPTRAQAARREMYLGTGYSRLGDFGEADKHFAKANEAFREGPEFGELAAHLMRHYLGQRDLEMAEKWQKESLADHTLRGKIRSEHLASYLMARQERYMDQATSLIKVLDLIGKQRGEYVEDWYVAVHALAVLARETPHPQAAKRAKDEVDFDFDWSPDFAVNRFQALKAVAWCQALAGDELSCFRYFRMAEHVEVAPVWRAILHLDRSFFASIVGENQWAVNEFSTAEDLAERVPWDETSGEERVALLLLAELATTHAPKKAPFYIARFNHLGKLRSSLHHFAFDDRLKAMSAYAAGLVSLSAGEKPAAEEHLRSAWRTFDGIGYDVRAAATALTLHRATGRSRWLHLAEDKLERYPRSWLARRLGEAPPIAETTTLSPMQAAVTRLLCEGLSTDDVARKLKLSRNTVLNHLKVVYRKLGVNSRGALVVAAIRGNLAKQ